MFEFALAHPGYAFLIVLAVTWMVEQSFGHIFRKPDHVECDCTNEDDDEEED